MESVLKKVKLLTVVGTRPEIIRLSETIKKCDIAFEHVLVHTGQNYDYSLNQVFFEDLGLRKPDYFLDANRTSTFKCIGDIIDKVAEIIDIESPDAFLVLGDTNSCLSAYAAKRKRVPVFHFEAGNRCFDDRLPEEINRRIVDHISDVNLTYSDHSRNFLLAEGKKPDSVIALGSPMYEVISKNTELLKTGTSVNNSQKYCVLSVHREDATDSPENLQSILEIIKMMILKFDLNVIFPLHPRTRNAMNNQNLSLDIDRLSVIEPLGFKKYLELQRDAVLVLSDSGTISEEASILGLRAVNLRENHERHEAMEYATVMFTGLSLPRIENAVNILLNTELDTEVSPWYLRDNISDRVVKIILSHIDKINAEVWRKA